MSGSDLCIPRNETGWPHFFQSSYYVLYPNFHIHVSVNPSQTNEGRNWEQGHAVSFLGTHKSDFQYSVLSLYSVALADQVVNVGVIPNVYFVPCVMSLFLFRTC
jgi:hypothetical protein